MKIDKDGSEITSSYYGGTAETSDLVGRVVTEVSQNEDTISMFFNDGYVAIFYHEQDCCESVWVEDVNGDWSDLYNTPLLVAEERSEAMTEGNNSGGYFESGTYTFYTFRTVKGSVDVRWCGESNGYYSESVDLKLWKEV